MAVQTRLIVSAIHGSRSFSAVRFVGAPLTSVTLMKFYEIGIVQLSGALLIVRGIAKYPITNSGILTRFARSDIG